jgi:hypothetical protein
MVRKRLLVSQDPSDEAFWGARADKAPAFMLAACDFVDVDDCDGGKADWVDEPDANAVRSDRPCDPFDALLPVSPPPCE